MPRRFPKSWSFYGAPALLLVIVILFHWKLTLTRQYTWMENPDLANLVLPWMQFQAGELHQHHVALWDPNSWMGQPLFGQGQPGSAYPINWLLFLAPLKNGWIRFSVLNWYYVLVRYLAALAAYALARSLGRSRDASILAGCIYALGGYVAYTYAPQMVNGAVWTPLVFLFLFRAERGPRSMLNAVLSGFFLGVGWLAGHHQMNFYVTLAAVGMWAWLSIRHRKLDRRMLKLAAASLVVAVLASGFQTIPMTEYGRLAVRWSGPPEPLHFSQTVPYTVHEQYSLKPLGLLGIFLPNFARGANAFVGVAAFALALLGVILAWTEKHVRWLATLSLCGIVFALGPNGLLHGILYSLIPQLDKARVPGAGVVLFSLGFAPLAAFGLDYVAAPAAALWSKRASWTLGVFGGFLIAIGFILSTAKLDGSLDDRFMITALVAIVLAAVLAAVRAERISTRALGACAIGLVLLELSNVTGYAFANRSDRAATPLLNALGQHSDLVDYIRSRGTALRFEYDDSLIPYNIGDWYGVEAVNAYTAGALAKIYDAGVFSQRSMDFFGVRFYLGKTPLRPGLTEMFTGSSGIHVYENRTALPRVWSVHAAVPAATPDLDPRRTAVLAGAIPEGIGGCSSNFDDVQMPLHQPNYVQIRAGMQCRGLVILTDPSYPGWRVYVDGKPAPLLEAYGSVRAVAVDAGDHLIEMRYRPWSVLLGGLMTALAGAVVLLALLRGRRAT